MRESTKQSNPSSIPNWETLEAWARSSIRDLLQRVLEEEVTEVLGRRRYERRSGVDGSPGLAQRLRQVSAAVRGDPQR